jgi:hypothetical protein
MMGKENEYGDYNLQVKSRREDANICDDCSKREAKKMRGER